MEVEEVNNVPTLLQRWNMASSPDLSAVRLAVLGILALKTLWVGRILKVVWHNYLFNPSPMCP